MRTFVVLILLVVLANVHTSCAHRGERLFRSRLSLKDDKDEAAIKQLMELARGDKQVVSEAKTDAAKDTSEIAEESTEESTVEEAAEESTDMEETGEETTHEEPVEESVEEESTHESAAEESAKEEQTLKEKVKEAIKEDNEDDEDSKADELEKLRKEYKAKFTTLTQEFKKGKKALSAVAEKALHLEVMPLHPPGLPKDAPNKDDVNCGQGKGDVNCKGNAVPLMKDPNMKCTPGQLGCPFPIMDEASPQKKYKTLETYKYPADKLDLDELGLDNEHGSLVTADIREGDNVDKNVMKKLSKISQRIHKDCEEGLCPDKAKPGE